MTQETQYKGFELGPIRPPSEAQSLMLRVTRNCPWNKCTFCGLYKNKTFSVRPVSHVKKDIDGIRRCADHILRAIETHGKNFKGALPAIMASIPQGDQLIFPSVLSWVQNGMESIFLQDANTLIVKPDNLVEILLYIRKQFPAVQRITSYSRSHTITRISDADLSRLADAGLNRIHIGMESASDAVLIFVKKGVDKKTHIDAGQKVMRAGIELSEYFMPGLGGEAMSRSHALETADAMSQINPDFIRLRTLGIPKTLELYKDVKNGAFTKCGDVASARELLLFLENLKGVTSTVKSDHILNLLQEVEGTLPQDKEKIIAPIKAFLALPEEEQILYMVGRRTGIFTALSDLKDPWLNDRAKQIVHTNQVRPETVDAFTAKMMTRFI